MKFLNSKLGFAFVLVVLFGLGFLTGEADAQVATQANMTMSTTPASSGGGSGSGTVGPGTVNTVAKFTGATVVGNSSATDDGVTFDVGENFTAGLSGSFTYSESGSTYLQSLQAPANSLAVSAISTTGASGNSLITVQSEHLSQIITRLFTNNPPPTDFASVSLTRGRGTIASPLALQNGDAIGRVVGEGQRSSTPNDIGRSSYIQFEATQNWAAGGTTQGSSINLYAVGNGQPDTGVKAVTVTNTETTFNSSGTPVATIGGMPAGSAGFKYESGVNFCAPETGSVCDTSSVDGLYVSSFGGVGSLEMWVGGLGNAGQITLNTALVQAAQDLSVASNLTVGGAEARLGGGPSALTLKFLEPSGSGVNFTSIRAQAQTVDIPWTLPNAQGGSNTFLRNDGSGNLSWAAAGGGGGTVGPGTTNRVSKFTASTTVGDSAISESGTATAIGYDGTAALPALTYGAVADPDTGIWHPAANTLAWSTAGSERMRLDAQGELGIGTNNPTAPFQINGGIGSSNYQVYWVGDLGASNVQVDGLRYELTTSGVGASAVRVGHQVMVSGTVTGGLGTSYVQGIETEVNTNSDSNNLRLSTATGCPLGNLGVNAITFGTTTGLNVGGYYESANGNLNIAVLAKSTVAKNSATNVGLMSVALNTGTSPVNVGAYVGLVNTTPTLTSAGLIVDNGAVAAPVQIWRVNGTERLSVDSAGALRVTGVAGAGVPTTIRNPNTTANYSWTQVYPASGTNVASEFDIIPKGTGFDATNKAQMNLYNTDYIADSSNYNFMGWRTSGTYGILATGKVGGASELPLVFSAGGLGAVGINTNQVYLDTTGFVGINKSSPGAFIDVDNGAAASSIQIWRDNGTAQWTMADNGVFTMNTDVSMVPATDNTGSIGTGARRFSLVRAVTITSGDIGFDDDGCTICHKAFEEGDDIVMHAHKRVTPSEGKPYILTVPIHADCRPSKHAGATTEKKHFWDGWF